MEIIIFVISILIALVLLPLIKTMLLDSNITKDNYMGNKIPVGMGILFIPSIIISSIFILWIMNTNYGAKETTLVFLVGIMTMGIIGVIDDLIGNRESTGFRGHISALFRGKLTTGGFKAIVGGLIALLISIFFGSDPIEIVFNTLIIALFTNLINLLDLRPGRAIKSFLFFLVIMLLFGVPKELRFILVSILGISLVYFPEDIKSRSMMGDVGSNILGVVLGITTVITFTFPVKAIITLFLISIHIVAEKYSLTEIIKRNPILNFLDELGRKNT